MAHGLIIITCPFSTKSDISKVGVLQSPPPNMSTVLGASYTNLQKCSIIAALQNFKISADILFASHLPAPR